MRNLQKLLALVLALVMSLALVTVAGAKDFTDVADDSDYAEAIDVMSAVGVIDGVGNNTFDPNGTLTREQAAKIVATMLLGSGADDLGTNTQIFSDVAAGRWSAGYIAYCANKGILAGVGGGKFDPAGILTGAQFGKMLLVALGYDPKYEGYTGGEWAINVASDMLMTGVNVDGIVLSAPLPRAQAAQMAFNTMTADLVEYNGRIDATIGDNNITVSNPASKIAAAAVSGAASTYVGYKTVDTDNDRYLQFCERYFTDLKLDETDTDDFGRTVDTWKLKKDDVGSYDSGDALVTYTAETKEDDVKKDLKGYSLFNDANSGSPAAFGQTRVWVDGKQEGTTATTASTIVTSVTGTKGIEDLTGNGRIVEVYADGKEITKIVVINAHLAKVTGVDDDDETVDYKPVNSTSYNYTLTSETGYGEVEKDDYVMINIKAATLNATALPATYATTDAVLAMTPATKVTGNITKVDTNKDVTIDGTVYDFAGVVADTAIKTATADNSLVDAYLDSFGYMVYNTANTDAGNYILVTKEGWKTTDEVNGDVYKFQGVLTDGTAGVFIASKVGGTPVAAEKTPAVGLYSYVISDGKYELTAAKAAKASANYGHEAASQKIEKGTVSVKADEANHYFTSDMKFIVVEDAGTANMKVNVYTGKQPLSAEVTVYYLTDKSVNDDTPANITTAFVTGATVSESSDDLIYAKDNTADGSVWIDGSKYDQHEVYINGEKQSIAVASGKGPDQSSAAFYNYSVDKNGVYSLTHKSTGDIAAAKTVKVFQNYVTVTDVAEGAPMAAADNIKVIDVADTGIDSLSKIADNANGVTASVIYDSDAKTVSVIYVEAKL